MTLVHPNSKADTVLLLDATVTDIFVDLGQYRTNLTDHTTYLDESPSARSAIDAPRNITVRLVMRPGWSGVILQLGNAVSYSYRINLTSGGDLQFAEAGLLRATVTPPSLSSAYTYLVHWSQRAAGTGVVDEISVYNYDTDEWEFATESHSDSAVSASDTLTVAAGYGGASPYSGGIESFSAVHIGRRFHSTTEAKEDWVGQSSPIVMAGRYRRPLLTGLSTDLQIANDGDFAGPTFNMGLAAVEQSDMRLVSPHVNIVTPYSAVEDNTYYPDNMVRLTPDNVHYRWSLRYLYNGIAVKTNRARVRIFVKAYNIVNPANPICPVHFSMYSIEDMYTLFTEGVVTNWRKTTPVAITTPAPDGVWLDLGSMQVLRDGGDGVYYALGYSFNLDAGGAYDDLTRFQIQTVTIEPYFYPVGDGDDGLGGGKGPGKKKK